MHKIFTASALLASVFLLSACCGGEDADLKPQDPKTSQTINEPPKEKPAPPPATQAPKKPEAQKAEPPKRPLFKKLNPSQKAQVIKDTSSFKKWLDDGRKAVRSKKYPEGIALYKKALKIAPDNAEAMGELGWAFYLQGQKLRAKKTISHALLFEDDPNRRAAMYYNLARIANDHNEIGAALDHLDRSLALRDNKTAKKLFQELQKKGAAPNKGSLRKVCAQAMDDWECAPRGEIASSDDYLGECTCEVTRTLKAPDANNPIQSAAILKIEGHSGTWGSIDGAESLAIQTCTGGWQLAATLTHNFTPGISQRFDNGTVTHMGFRTIAPGAPSALVAETTNREDDGDYSRNANEYYISDTIHVCYHAGSTSCLNLLVAGESGEEPMIEDEPSEVKTPTRTVWTLKARLDGQGNLVTSPSGAVANIPPASQKLKGTQALHQLRDQKLVPITPLR